MAEQLLNGKKERKKRRPMTKGKGEMVALGKGGRWEKG